MNINCENNTVCYIKNDDGTITELNGIADFTDISIGADDRLTKIKERVGKLKY